MSEISTAHFLVLTSCGQNATIKQKKEKENEEHLTPALKMKYT